MTKDHSARVISNAPETPAYWRLRVRISEDIAIRPGQFVMVRARDHWEPIWRRALVIYRAERHAEGMDLEFLYKVLGRGTQQLSRQRPGDELEMLGPLGNGFSPEMDPHAEAILVSGGIGLPALYLLAESLAHEGRSVRLFHGEPTVKPHANLPALEDFARVLGREAITLATEDGSAGIQGLVTEALQAYLDRARPRRASLYACGPLPMLRRIAEIAAATGLPAYVALEARMACGFGVCLGCVVPTRSRSDRTPHGDTPRDLEITWGPRYRRVCVEGPIFRAEEVIWDEL